MKKIDNKLKFLSLLIEFVSKYEYTANNALTKNLAFQELILPICEFASISLNDKVSSGFINSPIIKQLEANLYEVLTQHLLGPIFYNEFIKFRPRGINYLLKIAPKIVSNSSEHYDKFILHMKHKELGEILLEYSVLTDLLYKVIKDWMVYVKKIHNFIVMNKIEFGDIENIQLLDPLVLKFSECSFAIKSLKTKLVYMPRKDISVLNYKKLFNKIAKLVKINELGINSKIEFHDDFTLIVSQHNNEKINYEKVGALLFLMLILKGNKLDSKFLNSVINNNFNSLDLIDLSLNKFFDEYHINEENLENVFESNDNILLSLKLFQNNRYTKSIFIDLNKIVDYSNRDLLDYMWLNLFQDFLSIELKKVKPELLDISNVLDKLLVGFRKAFDKFKNIETIENFFSMPEISNLLTKSPRVLLRNSQNYQRIFVSNLKLENLKSTELWEQAIRKKLSEKIENVDIENDAELVEFEVRNIAQGVLPIIDTTNFSLNKFSDINLKKLSGVKLIDKKIEQLDRLPYLYFNSISSDSTVHNNIKSFKLGSNQFIEGNLKATLKSRIDGLRYKIIKNNILFDESIEDQNANSIHIDNNGREMYFSLRELISQKLGKFDDSKINENTNEYYYQFLLYRTLLQTVALQSNFLEWRCPAYSQTQQVNYFHPLNQTNYIVNYDRGNSHFLSELETHMAKVLNVDTTKYSFYLTSSGMASYKLIEAILMFDYLNPGDTILIPHYIYFETYEQIKVYKHLNIINAENAVSADEIINLIKKHKPKVLYLDPLLNTENLEYIDTKKILVWLDEQGIEINVVIDGTMLSGLYRPENYLKRDTKIKFFFYESCTKYLQLGLDTNMAGYIVVPKKLNLRAYDLRMRTATILYDNAVTNFPIYKRQDLIARTQQLTSNAVFITDFVNNSPALSGRVQAHHPSSKSHKHYDLVHDSGFEDFAGGLIGFSIASIKGSQKEINDKLGEIVDEIMHECKKAAIPITKGLGFGFVLARICVNTFFDNKTPSYLRLYVGELDKNNLLKLCEVLNKVFGKLETI